MLSEAVTGVWLKNLQSHADTTLDLSSGVNVVVGSSDSGKTAVLRGLRWLVENRPAGDGLRSWWGGDTEVVVRLATGEEVSRARSRAKNGYTLTVDHGNGPEVMLFEAMGQSVPGPVDEVLRLNDICFQWQHDSPFMLAGTPGEAARELNRAARLDLIDAAASKMESAKRIAAADVAHCYSDRVIAEARVKALPDMIAIYELLSDAELLARELKIAAGAADALAAGLEGIDRARDGLRKSIVVPADAAEEVERLLRELGDASAERTRLATAIDAVSWARGAVEAARAAESTAMKSAPKICPTCGKAL